MSHSDHSSPLGRVFTILRPDRRDLGFVVTYAISVGLLSLAIPITASAVVNTVALTALFQQLVVLCVALFVALSLAAFFQLLQQIVVEYVQRRVFARISVDLAEQLPRVELQAFDRQHGPELVNRFFDVLTVQKASATLLMDGIALALQILIGLVLLATYDSILLGFDAILVAGLALIVFPLGRNGVRTAIGESKSKYAVASWLQELARNPVAFKLAGGPEYAMLRAEALTRNYLVARSEHFRVLLRQISFGLLIQVGASVSLLALGGYMVIDGRLTLGQLVAAQIVVNLVVSSFGKIGKQLENWYDLLAGADKIGHLLDLPRENSGREVYSANATGAAVAICNISFAYDDDHPPVIRNLSLQLASGERLALMGPNGSGKSTLVELLLGLRTPQSGWIEIDGVDLRDLNSDSFRQRVAIVQGLEIFEGTVVENIRMGRPHIALAEIRQALDRVGVLNDVLDFPQGLETSLATGGAPLSLGQAERLMLARAIAGNPRLLILDETLDTMDRELRDSVLSTVFNREASWTLVVITHSHDIAKLCDHHYELPRSRENIVHLEASPS